MNGDVENVEILAPGGEYVPSSELAEWIDATWPALWAGFDVVIPTRFHPEIRASWADPVYSEPHGHVTDRVLSTRKSRVHAREWATGTWTLHVDRWDPARGPFATATHLATETSLGKAVVGLVASASIAYAVGAYSRLRK